MASRIFVNLPVEDLEKSMAFFKEVGFDFNAQSAVAWPGRTGAAAMEAAGAMKGVIDAAREAFGGGDHGQAAGGGGSAVAGQDGA